MFAFDKIVTEFVDPVCYRRWSHCGNGSKNDPAAGGEVTLNFERVPISDLHLEG